MILVQRARRLGQALSRRRPWRSARQSSAGAGDTHGETAVGEVLDGGEPARGAGASDGKGTSGAGSGRRRDESGAERPGNEISDAGKAERPGDEIPSRIGPGRPGDEIPDTTGPGRSPDELLYRTGSGRPGEKIPDTTAFGEPGDEIPGGVRSSEPGGRDTDRGPHRIGADKSETDGIRANGTRTDATSTDGTPTDGARTNATPTNGTPTDRTRARGSRRWGGLVEGAGRAILLPFRLALLQGDADPPPASRRLTFAVPRWLGALVPFRTYNVTQVADVVLAFVMYGLTISMMLDWNLRAAVAYDLTRTVPGPVPLIFPYLAALGVSAPIALRDRWPLAAWRVALVMLPVVIWVASRLEMGSPPYPIPAIIMYLMVLYSVAVRCDRRITLAVWIITVLILWIVHPNSMPLSTVVVSVAVLFGYNVRVRRTATDRLVQEELRTQQAESAQAVLAERARIARELHDVVAHHMSVIAIQAEAVPLKAAGDPAQLEAGLAEIRGLSLEAIAELRQVLGVLRDHEGRTDTAPQPGLDRIDELVTNARAAGLSVLVERSGSLDGLPPAVGLSAYRIVQESLSNAMRHAPGATVTVDITRKENELRLHITNGPATNQPVPSTGTGRRPTPTGTGPGATPTRAGRASTSSGTGRATGSAGTGRTGGPSGGGQVGGYSSGGRTSGPSSGEGRIGDPSSGGRIGEFSSSGRAGDPSTGGRVGDSSGGGRGGDSLASGWGAGSVGAGRAGSAVGGGRSGDSLAARREAGSAGVGGFISHGRAAGASGVGHGSGQGLVGMRERAALLGGTLDAGPAADGGFEVRATLPITERESS
ncbi:Signal transduction histidine kinase [Nonomuraea solani]|uniref:histidine kinase n=1 Tax=Nonomuraea solani TaxID=1144553 RepID=A0A1H6EZ98_9ACTN|nr:histidine kinase [Nonomuraea solani]SEH02215.1 Signal transduction histidine kinase [Nonomuraea solani]